MNQREVWENISEDWSRKRPNPFPDAVEFLKNKKGLILDVGCGSGRNFLPTNGKFIGIDFSKRMLRLAKNKAGKNRADAHLVVSDALEVPFNDNSFDVILASRVLHCIKWNKREKFLQEITRVAKNGTPVFISVWDKDQPRFAGAEKESLIGWTVRGKTYQRYYYLYSKDELEALMKKYFRNVRVFGSQEKAFKKYPKNIIATGKVKKAN